MALTYKKNNEEAAKKMQQIGDMVNELQTELKQNLENINALIQSKKPAKKSAKKKQSAKKPAKKSAKKSAKKPAKKPEKKKKSAKKKKKLNIPEMRRKFKDDVAKVGEKQYIESLHKKWDKGGQPDSDMMEHVTKYRNYWIEYRAEQIDNIKKRYALPESAPFSQRAEAIEEAQDALTEFIKKDIKKRGHVPFDLLVTGWTRQYKEAMAQLQRSGEWVDPMDDDAGFVQFRRQWELKLPKKRTPVPQPKKRKARQPEDDIVENLSETEEEDEEEDEDDEYEDDEY